MRNRTLHGVRRAAAAALLLLALTTARRLHAQEGFSEAELFFELNDTDGDLGIHASIDGDGWRVLTIRSPQQLKILDISVRHTLRQQGLTQLMFESAEPSFDELAPEVFFERFPEGTYSISGHTVDGVGIQSEATVTHVIPAAPAGITVNGFILPEDCHVGPIPTVSGNVRIMWDPVESTHPHLGAPRASSDIDIDGYEVFVNQESVGLAFELDPAVTEVLIPAALLSSGAATLEVLVREASHNQTATETCFEVQ